MVGGRRNGRDVIRWQKVWKGASVLATSNEDVILHGMRPSCNMGEFVPSSMARLVESDHIL